MMNKFKKTILEKRIKEELKINGKRVEVNPSSCDGCGKCVEVCPNSAISLVELSKEKTKQLSFKGRLKVFIKGNNKAFINDYYCTCCGLCIKNCHEFAIHKVR